MSDPIVAPVRSHAAMRTPLPPLIAPLLVSVVIVPAFDTAPPPPVAAAAAADLAAVGQHRDCPGVRHADAARAAVSAG